MAYKFQRGEAIFSGSAQFEDGLVSTDVDDTTAANIVAEIDNGEIPIAKLSATTISGKTLGNNLDSLSKATNGGVTFTSYNGSAAVSDLKLDITDLADGSIANGDFFVFADADDSGNNKVEAIADLAALFAGDGLAAANSVMAVQVSGALKIASDKVGLSGSIAGNGLAFTGGQDSISSLSVDIDGLGALGGTGLHQTQDHFMFSDNGTEKKITFSNLEDAIFGNVSGDATIAAGGALTIAADSVEGTMLNTNAADGSTMELSSDSLSVLKVPNALTAGDGIDAAGTFDGAAARTLSISAAQTTITSIKNANLVIGADSGNDHIDFSAAGTVAIDTNNIARLSITDATSTFSNDLVVAGNLTVQGTTTTVDSTTINVSSSFTFEGVADDFETTLGIVDPAADRTILLPNNSGVLALFDPSLSDSELATTLTAAPSELNLLDAGAGSSVGLASGDGVIIFDASDSNSAKKVLVSDIVSLGQTLGVASKADGNNLEADKVNYFGDLNTSATVTLPASAGLVAGQSVYIKAKNLTGGAFITINTQASAQKIDGEDSIRLESPFASVRLIYVAADDFRVF